MYGGHERRRNREIADEHYEEIADRVAFKVSNRVVAALAADLAERITEDLEERFYHAVGKWTFQRLLLPAGAISGGLYLLFEFLKKTGVT